MSLRATTVECADLSLNEIEQMFELYSACYQDTCRIRFGHDLDDKTHCVILRDAGDRIVGFTTLKLFEMLWQNQLKRFVFSGDTIIDPEHWGSQQLTFAWSRLVGDLWRQRPQVPFYWFLICKGHRTYRYLRAMILNYAPRAGQVTAPDVQALMDHLATTHFGDAYDSTTGLLRFQTLRVASFQRWQRCRRTTQGLRRSPIFWSATRAMPTGTSWCACASLRLKTCAPSPDACLSPRSLLRVDSSGAPFGQSAAA